MNRITALFLSGLVCTLVFGGAIGRIEGSPVLASDTNNGVTLPAGVSPDWWTQVRDNIRKEAYVVAWQDETPFSDLDGSWASVNPANNFRTFFTESGVRIVPGAEETHCWVWGLELRRWGREDAWKDAARGTLHEHWNRIELDRGDIKEWFVNDEIGLEQGFTIPSAPASGLVASSSANHLLLDLTLSTGLRPVFSGDGQAVDFYDNGGVHILRYAELKVVDAEDAALSSRMIPIQGGIRFEIDDSNAVYPITIDPLATTPAWIVTGDQDLSKFGECIATAGDVNGDGYSDVIVGVRSYNEDINFDNSGRAYVYLGSAAGLSTSAAWIVAGDQEGAQFGKVVATAGDVNGDGYSDIIVAAPAHDDDGYRRGRVYAYHGSAAGLGTTATWTVSGEVDTEYFGWAIASAGDVNGDGYSDVIVGSPSNMGGGNFLGMAFVYLGSASGLSEGEAWTATGDFEAGYFGISVSSAGDVNGDGYSDVIIGATYANFGGWERGRAYVFQGSSSGLGLTPVWTADGDENFAHFGESLATAGDVNGDGYSDVIVGAPGYDGVGDQENTRGRAYLFRGSASGPAVSASWTSTGESDIAKFGSSLSTAGDVNGDGYSDVIVGAPVDAGGEEFSGRGRAYVYLGSESGLDSGAAWTASGDEYSAELGTSVAIAGDVNGDGYSDIIIAAPGHDGGSEIGANRGRVYLYQGSSAGLSSAETWPGAGDQDLAFFGWSVSTAGDVNGDSYSDVIVGAPRHDAGGTSGADRGRAYLYLGTTDGLAFTPSWTGSGDSDSVRFGESVSAAGDVNGDGFSDIIIGALYHDGDCSTGARCGRAYAYYGSPAGITSPASWMASGDEVDGFFGYSVSNAGDVNGDGYADVIIGVPYYNGGGTDRGRAYVFCGSTSGLGATAAWTASMDTDGDLFGYSVSTAGDVNGDGYSDVIIGSHSADYIGPDRGRVYVYHGSSSGLPTTASWYRTGPEDDAEFGWSVATAGDVNGDGYSDVLIGATGVAAGGTNRGQVRLYPGSEDGLHYSPSWTISGYEDSARLGWAVASAGDVNGDGFSDIIVSAVGQTGLKSNDRAFTNSGLAMLYLGSAVGPGSTAAWSAYGTEDNANFGNSLSTAGDVNGDGYADVIVAARGNDEGGTDRGRAFIYQGNGGGGTINLPRQMRADQSVPISPLGLAYDEMCRIGMRLRSPFGRTLVSMEWQMVPQGSTFIPAYSPIQQTSVWWNSGLFGTNRTVRLDLTDPESWGLWTWRIRARYALATTLFQSHGPWFTPVANGLSETDLRSSSVEPPPPCVAPDEPCWLYQVDKNGTDYTLNWQDPNQADQRTGWNIRRSNDPAPPKDTWPLVGTNVVDMDAGTSNVQWTDHSGADPTPSAIWYFQVTTCNVACPAEGPF